MLLFGIYALVRDKQSTVSIVTHTLEDKYPVHVLIQLSNELPFLEQ